jgi:hypothetical protein
MYRKEFIEIVNYSFEKSQRLNEEEITCGNPYYIGFGNPNSKILIFGKEKGFTKANTYQLEYESLKNPTEWKEYVEAKTKINSEIKYSKNGNYINAFCPYLEENKSGHTWNKYYVLLNKIVPTISKENNDFFKHSFISEINHKPAKRSEIKHFKNSNRIEMLRHDYFKTFDITILACGNYLDRTSIEEIFNVKFDNSNLSVPRQKLEIFKNGNRILINTRQLSFDVSNEYLQRIADNVKMYL